jgi:hypothetical protein
MIKLSELSDDAELCVQYGKYEYEFYVMTKIDFLNEYRMEKQNRGYEVYAVSLAEKDICVFDLDDTIDSITEDCYEGCRDDVLYDLDKDITSKFVEHINEIFAKHPTYYPGKTVLVDM